MRILMGAACAGVLLIATGCSSVRVVQREGCWVKRTEKAFGQVNEELGPCVRQPTEWAQDRQTRLVQECVTQADHRWQTQAIAAWSRGQPLPPPQDEEGVLQACMSEAGRAMVAENDALKQRLAELDEERKALAAAVDDNRSHLRANNDKLTEFLGQAAQKPAGTATATATSLSDGNAKTENGSSVQSTPATFVPASQVTPVCTTCDQPQQTPAKKAPVKKASNESPERQSGPSCEVPAKPAVTKGAPEAKIAEVVPQPKPDAAQAPFSPVPETEAK